MATLPTWIVILHALLTPAIGAAVAFVAYMQWRTAHQKVILDLFERRLNLYDQLIDAVHFSLSEEGRLSTISVSVRIMSFHSSSRFIFGSEVSNAILEIRDAAALYGHAYQQTENRNISEEKRDNYFKIAESNYTKIMSFKESFTALCLPYMLMDQKRVRSLPECFHDKNQERLSYADEKQR